MSSALQRTAARWHEIWAPHSRGSTTAIAAELDRLVAAYSSAERHYHDIHHIDALIDLSRVHRGALNDPVAVDLAIYYHDAVYDPSRHDNEEASAALARTALSALGLKSQSIARIAHLIEATKHIGGGGPEAGAADTDLDHLLDFDLSVLAAETEVYGVYAAAIRREYSIFPDDAYRKGRARVLTALLSMPALYRVPALAATWEARARCNLKRELSSLGPP